VDTGAGYLRRRYNSRITTLQRPGEVINGIISLESQIIQKVLFSKQEIYAAGTNYIIGSNYIGETQTVRLSTVESDGFLR
jgi:hypothetical protein